MVNSDEQLAAIESALLDFMAAYRQARIRLARDPRLAGLTNSQFIVLASIVTHGTEGVSALARRVEMSQPATTRAVSRLVAVGLVDQSKDPEDSRRSVLAVTAEGHRVLRHHRARLRQAAKALQASVPTRNRNDLPKVLTSLGEALGTMP